MSGKKGLRLVPLGEELTVCKVASPEAIDWRGMDLYFVGRTAQEVSLVCPTKDAPADTVAREDGWRGLRVAGTLDFSLIGILAGLTGVLRDAGISVFCLSTYDTDYVLTRADRFDEALRALAQAGYAVEENE